MQAFHKIITPDSVHYFHYRDIFGRTLSGHNFDGLTLAVIQIGQQAKVGEARCSVNDSFCKKIGRNIALGRAKKQFASDLGFTWRLKKNGNALERARFVAHEHIMDLLRDPFVHVNPF